MDGISRALGRVGAGRGDEAADNKIVHGRRKA